MFRSLMAVVAVMLLSFVAGSFAQDKKNDKEVTLKGEVCCAKCELKESQKCHTVVRVKENNKNVVYYFDDASSKKHHGEICTACKEGTVVGTVSEKDGKKWVKVAKVEFKKS